MKPSEKIQEMAQAIAESRRNLRSALAKEITPTPLELVSAILDYLDSHE